MLKIQFTHEDNGNHFDYYINDQLYGRLTDPDTLYNPDQNSLYAGVMMHGNRNNAIDNFTIKNTTSFRFH